MWLQQALRKYWPHARLSQRRADSLQAHLEMHAAEILQVMDRLQKGITFKSPVLLPEPHDRENTVES
jgi:hypothetical protein